MTGTYRSTNNHRTTYQAEVTETAATCTCKGYRFNRKCWHITDLMQQMGRKALRAGRKLAAAQRAIQAGRAARSA